MQQLFTIRHRMERACEAHNSLLLNDKARDRRFDLMPEPDRYPKLLASGRPVGEVFSITYVLLPARDFSLLERIASAVTRCRYSKVRFSFPRIVQPPNKFPNQPNGRS